MKNIIGFAVLGLCFCASASAKIVDRIIAQVNDDIITLSDLNRELEQVRQQLASQYSGEKLEQEVKKLEKNALDSLIQEKLLLQKATELGFNANVDVQVSATLERIRKENRFSDMQEFERVLAQQTGMNLAAYREQIRRQIITRSLVDSFVGSRITLLTAEIERYYKDHLQEFAKPEEITLSEIVISVEGNDPAAKARADEIHGRLLQGEEFAAMASQYSKGATANKGGGIGTYVTGKLNPEIVKAVAQLKPGDVSAVTKNQEGYVIYRLDERKEASFTPMEDVKTEIQRRLWDQKFTPEYQRFIAQLKEDAYIQIFTEGQ